MKDKSRCRDLTGMKFGRLTAIGIDDSKPGRKTYWVCECECGNVSSHRADGLLSGSIKSCGCLKIELSAERVAKNHKHKQSGTRLYNIWQGIKERCYNEHSPSYSRYGGRGIRVSDEWKNDFSKFYEWALSNGYRDDLTIDRINNSGNYEPGNCRWATKTEQARNRRSNINIKIGNATKTLYEWCEIFDLDFKTVVARYHRNGFVSIDELFNH